MAPARAGLYRGREEGGRLKKIQPPPYIPVQSGKSLHSVQFRSRAPRRLEPARTACRMGKGPLTEREVGAAGSAGARRVPCSRQARPQRYGRSLCHAKQKNGCRPLHTVVLSIFSLLWSDSKSFYVRGFSFLFRLRFLRPLSFLGRGFRYPRFFYRG